MDILVIRINKSGVLLNSAPCFHCAKLLRYNKLVKIIRIYYSVSGGVEKINFSEYETSHISKQNRHQGGGGGGGV